jgi:hypothetical protein
MPDVPRNRRRRRRGGWRVAFTITFGIIAVVVGAGLILLYLFWASARDELRFVVAALATVGGVASAYYIGSGLRATAESEKLTRTFAYPARWGDPPWAPARKATAELLKECQGKPEAERLAAIQKALKAKPELERDIIAVLNYLEELALAVNLGVVDEQIVKRFYRSTVVRGYRALAPWVKTHRDERESETIWSEIEALYDTWKQEG